MNKNNCLFLVLILMLLMYCYVVNESFYDFEINLNKKFNKNFILDFENSNTDDSTKLDNLKKYFTTNNYSGLKKDENQVNFKITDKTGRNIWSGGLAEYDPTGGNVKYINELKDDYTGENLISINNNLLKLELGDPVQDKTITDFLHQDESNKVYPSIRLTSKNSFHNNKQHLFILKAKLPFGKSLWPAWWLTGTDNGEQSSLNKKWPTNGEIDVIELVNEESQFKNVLHMCKSCNSQWKNGPKMNGNNKWGNILDCEGQYNSGCSTDGDTNVFQNLTTFENQLGGVFACYWNPKKQSNVKINDNDTVDILGTIKFYYWDYHEKNLDKNNGPLSKNPDQSKWEDDLLTEVRYWKGETEETDFNCKENGTNTNCNFNNLKMVFNTTVCGDWAGNVFETDSGDPKAACLNYIKDSTEIKKSFWEISYIAAFDKNID